MAKLIWRISAHCNFDELMNAYNGRSEALRLAAAAAAGGHRGGHHAGAAVITHANGRRRALPVGSIAVAVAARKGLMSMSNIT